MWLLKLVLFTSLLRKTVISLSKNIPIVSFFSSQPIFSYPQIIWINFFSFACTGIRIFLYVWMSSNLTLTNDRGNQRISIVNWKLDSFKIWFIQQQKESLFSKITQNLCSFSTVLYEIKCCLGKKEIYDWVRVG